MTTNDDRLMEFASLGVLADRMAATIAPAACDVGTHVSLEAIESLAKDAAELHRRSAALLVDALRAAARARSLTIPPAGLERVDASTLALLARAASPTRDADEARATAENIVRDPFGFCAALELERARFASTTRAAHGLDAADLQRYADALSVVRERAYAARPEPRSSEIST